MSEPLKTYRIGEDGEVVKSQRDKILSAEQYLATLPQVEVQIKHTFAHGTYAREIEIPAGVCCTGKVHKFDDLNIVPYGHMTVMTEDGWKEVVGPCTFKGCAGVKKIGYAHENTLWITIHATDETDLDIIESTLFAECDGEPKVIDFKTGKPIQEALL